MPPRYDSISRAAYLLDDDAPAWTGKYRLLDYPEAWNACVLNLCNLGRGPEREPFRMAPTRRIDGVLQTLAPDLIVRPRASNPANRDASDAWLYVPDQVVDPLPNQVLQQLAGAWMRDLRPEPAYLRDVMAAHAELQAKPPQWRGQTVDLLGCPTTLGGTADPSPRQFQLAADALARRIADLEAYDFGAGSLHFRAVPRGPYQRGAELVSQPMPYEAKSKTSWFSIYIAVSLHTVPFDRRPRLHLHTGVRRWVTTISSATGRVRLPARTETSVYLLPPIPWMAGAPASRRFAIASLGYDRARRTISWGSQGPAQLLQRLSLNQEFPDPDQLLTDPERWIGEGRGVRAAILHSNRMGAHIIGAGLMSHQRSQITEWAEQALPPGLTRANALHRTRSGTTTPSNARPTPTTDVAKKAEQARAAQGRRSALAESIRRLTPESSANTAVPVVARVRLLWQTPTLRDTAIKALAEVLGLDGDGTWPAPPHTDETYDNASPGTPAVLTWKTSELTVELRCLRLVDGLASGLGIAGRSGSKAQALAAGIAERRQATFAMLTGDGADKDRPELGLVEIDRPQDFATRLDDPKFALRLGCADAGILTQFVLVPKKEQRYNSEKNVDHRTRSAWLDGLRQLGVRVVPETTAAGLPAGLRYVGFWMVKRRRDGPTGLERLTPVAVMIQPLGQGLAEISGWDQETLEWIPYPTFLLRQTKNAETPETGTEDHDDETAAPDPDQPPNDVLASNSEATTVEWSGGRRLAKKRKLDEQRGDTARYLQKMIRSLRGAPTLLLTHSQNSRMLWPWLKDGETEPDLLKTGIAPATGLDHELWLVRVRDGNGGETPQWWGNPIGSLVNGLPPGLWIDDTPLGRVFYSTTPKAGTFKKSAVEADKLAPRPMRLGANKGKPTIDTEIPAWNPSLIEIVILGCHRDRGDIPEALALAVHHLRQAPDYLDALALPLPVHLAKLAQQYVLPTVAKDDRDDDDVEEVAEADEDGTPTDPLSTSLGLRVTSRLVDLDVAT